MLEQPVMPMQHAPWPTRRYASPRTRWPRNDAPIRVFLAVHLLVIACAVGLGYATMAPVAATTDQDSMAFPIQMFVQLAVTIPVLAWALTRDHWLARRIAAVVAQGLFLLPAVAGLYIAGIVACAVAPVAVPAPVAMWASLALAVGGTAAAYVWNRVIVHDAVMVVAITVFTLVVGIKVGVVPCIAFLAAMCAVDAVAVYFSKHMVTLAERSMERRLFPILIVPPTRAGLLDDAREAARDRAGGTAVLGLGDIGIPSMLVVSATFFAGPGPALGAVAGIVAGYGVLALMLRRGTWHAGLPPLAGGAIIGCLLGALLTGVALW
jgi:presenilin-like A22 family membrane protease